MLLKGYVTYSHTLLFLLIINLNLSLKKSLITKAFISFAYPLFTNYKSMLIKKTTIFIIGIIVFGFGFLNAQIPSGYYNDATGLSGEQLQSALHNIIDNHNSISYSALWNAFTTTDNAGSNQVWDMYANCGYSFGSDQCGSYGGECDCFNREHSFPSSWFNDGSPMYTDLFQIVPTDGYINGLRANYPYGETSSASYTSGNGSKVGPNSIAGYSGTIFEPADEYKGDFARNYFYMATRYKDIIANWENYNSNGDVVLDGTSFPVYESWFLDMIMTWHSDDPVSQKEIDRNNAVYAIQNNRNPFIDHPEYVDLIWGEGLEPEPLNQPNEFSAHNIVLNWTDAVNGILPDGYLIRMSDVGFESIVAPTDGIAVSNDFSNQNVAYGIETCTFSGLTEGTVYYFKIYGYTGSGNNIDYKTDGTIQQISIEAN